MSADTDDTLTPYFSITARICANPSSLPNGLRPSVSNWYTHSMQSRPACFAKENSSRQVSTGKHWMTPGVGGESRPWVMPMTATSPPTSSAFIVADRRVQCAHLGFNLLQRLHPGFELAKAFAERLNIGAVVYAI